MMVFPTELQEILDQVINNLAKWDLVAYMQRNPNSRISADAIASSIGRSTGEVMEALIGLAESGLVQYEDDGEAIYYKFNPDKSWQKHIEKFNESLMDRNTRWLILNYLIEKHGFKETS